MFARSGTLSLEGFSGSGADWLERFKPYIEDGKTVVVSPHKVFGPQVGEVMALVQTAMLAGLPCTSLRDAILTHSTMAEGLTVLFANVPPLAAT